MKSILLLCGVLGAVSDASECQADEHSLLQSRTRVRKHAQANSQAVLKNMRDVANSLLDGSVTTMTSDEVNDALDAASNALAELLPAIRQQIENAQQQINDAASAVQVCHSQEQAQLRLSLRDNVEQRSAAVESCQDTLGHFQADETRQCNIAEDCLCDEARAGTTGQEALCASTTETYEAVFCEQHMECNLFHQCHSQEAQVFARLRADVEAEMALVVQEYIAVEQSRCLTGLSMEAITPPRTPISHAALIACDVVDVSALSINFPALPSEPAACPAHTHGDPPCFRTPSGATVVGPELRLLSVGQAASVTLRYDPDFTAAVSCCATDASEWIGMSHVTPERLQSSRPKWTSEVACATPGHVHWGELPSASCSGAVTFAAAREMCSALGARLCLASEVAACYGTGCGFYANPHNVWVLHDTTQNQAQPMINNWNFEEMTVNGELGSLPEGTYVHFVNDGTSGLTNTGIPAWHQMNSRWSSGLYNSDRNEIAAEGSHVLFLNMGDNNNYVYQDLLRPFTSTLNIETAVCGGNDEENGGYRFGLYTQDGTLVQEHAAGVNGAPECSGRRYLVTHMSVSVDDHPDMVGQTLQLRLMKNRSGQAHYHYIRFT